MMIIPIPSAEIGIYYLKLGWVSDNLDASLHPYQTLSCKRLFGVDRNLLDRVSVDIAAVSFQLEIDWSASMND